MAEHIVEKEFEHKGLKCVITFSYMGHRCGYVGVPKEHPLYNQDYRNREISNLSCHGGVTYADGGVNSNYPIESDLWWIGFDCAHCCDGKDLDLALKKFPDKAQSISMLKMFEIGSNIEVRSLEYVEENCKELAEQLSELI